MTSSQLDLSKLALDRPSADSGEPAQRRSRWMSRYVLPAAILIGFLALLGTAAGRQLFPLPSVTVVPVIVKRGDSQRAGTPLFQAAGWIEPRPTSVSVAALAPGVIDELLVVEGQQLAKGEPIARLIAIDAELAVEQAKATLAIREGELQRAQAEQTAAITRLEKPVHLKAQLADAKSLLAKATTEMAKLPYLITAAEANVAFARSSLDGKQAAKNAIAGLIIEQAASTHASANAALEELQMRGPHLKREIDALQEKTNALQEQLQLLVEERRQAEEAKAKMASAIALRNEARVRLRLSELTLQRTVVRAPIDGRVLRLLSSPGARVMGLQHTAGQSSSTVIEMYNPKQMQVRADVRLEDVPKVVLGASVEIQTASSGKPIQGRVLQLTSSANIQKNTLEVKVELIDPPQTVSPEMLVTAIFLAPTLDTEQGVAATSEHIFAPRQLIETDAGGSAIWIVDSDHRAIRRRIEVGQAGPEGLVEITRGLFATDKLIASGAESLDVGAEVIVTGEDQAMGVER
ncbi:MAG: efflux RND transporter periplasmic adaptor subunit [Rubripirellula sp.]